MAVIEGITSGNKAEVDVSNNILTKGPGYTAAGVSIGGGNDNATAMFSENDPGTITGARHTLSPETDDDFRLRIGTDLELDDETFNYTAQNTGKHNNQNTTMTFGYTTGGLQTNASSITTTTTGLSLQTYAFFPLLSNGANLYCQSEVAFSAQPTANTIVDFGLFLRPTSNPYAPTDGVYFRLTSAGLSGVINHNGTETTTSVFSTYTYANNAVHKYTIAISNKSAEFWIDDILYAEIVIPVTQAQAYMSTCLPYSFRHVITGGAAGAIMQVVFRGYGISIGGLNITKGLGELGNSVFGSYQGLSGGTMGQLIAGTVTTGTLVKPTAAVPANTSLTANLPAALGGRIYETLTSGLAANTDAIFTSYQVPAGTVSVQGRRLKVTGIKLSGMVSTVVVGGPAYTEWYIAFGHTAASLQTAEAATTKAPRRVMLPELTTNMAAAAVAGTLLTQPQYFAKFDNPIYVNPGEFIALVGNKTITTAITSGILSYIYQFDYSWE
jgi:hypothetical protein